jgi:uncharacterized membrane protein YraQ (UPF0718 family)
LIYLYIITAGALILSLIADPGKTGRALKIALKRALKILPAFGIMLILISIALTLLPDSLITEYLGNRNLPLSVFSASLFGSLTLMPGFIAFPLCGILLGKGVSYMVLSAFTTTLMMVGVLTLPIESVYLGNRVAAARNLTALIIALIVAFITGIIFGEVF